MKKIFFSKFVILLMLTGCYENIFAGSVLPPVNDDPCGAIAIPINTYSQSYTNIGAPLTTGLTFAGCQNSSDVDVWFYIDLPYVNSNSGATVNINAYASSINEGGMSIYESYSGTCNDLNEITCSRSVGGLPFISYNYNPLFNSSRIWIRVLTNSLVSGDIGVSATMNYTTNNEPCNALDIYSAEYSSSCKYINFNMDNIGNSSSVPAPSCATTTITDNIWFKTSVFASTMVIDTKNLSGNLSDCVMAVYSGGSGFDCNNLTLIACDDNSGFYDMPQLTLNNLQLGTEIYIRFWDKEPYMTFNNQYGICVSQVSTPGACLFNNTSGSTIDSSVAVCSFNNLCGTTPTSVTPRTWPELNNAFSQCNAYIDNSTFVRFVPSTSFIDFKLYVTSSRDSFGVQAMIFGCDNLGYGPVTNYGCFNYMQKSNFPFYVNATGLTPGKIYYLMIDGFGGDVCSYNVTSYNSISNPANVLFSKDTIYACGSSYLLDAGYGYNSYRWNSGATTQKINVTVPGWYKCNVSNQTCTGSDSVYVSVVNANIQNRDTILCRGPFVATLTADATLPVSMKDINGNVYSALNIGSQTWTQKNLNVSRYKNGDIIPQITNAAQWASLTTGAWCWYNNDSATFAATYGKLYNWYAVNDPRGLAPDGWHIPSDYEWNKLIKYIDVNADTICGNCVQSTNAGGRIKETGTSRWLTPNSGANNLSGMLGLPAGLRDRNGAFQKIGSSARWWTASAYNTNLAISRDVNYNDSSERRLYDDGNGSITSSLNKMAGFSIRCVRNTPTYLWSTGATTPSISINNSSSATYYVTVNNGISSCIDSMKVTISTALPSTPGIISGPNDVCSYIGRNTISSAVNYKISKIANATSYVWSIPAGVTLLSGQGDTSVNLAFSSTFVSGVISIISVNGCGNSSARTLTVYKRVSVTPTAIQKEFTPISIAAITSVCGLSSSVYRIKKVTYAVGYNWSLKVGTKATITHVNPSGVNDTAVIITYQAGFTKDTLSVSSATFCSTSTEKSVYLNATLAPPAVTSIVASTNNFTPCIGNTVTYTATASVPTTSQSSISVYRWTRPNYTTISSASSDSSSITLVFNTGFIGGSISAKGQSACGIAGTAKSVTFQYLTPTPTGILSRSGLYNACINDTITYTVVVPAPTTTQRAAVVYRWTRPNYTTILSAATDSSFIKLKFITGYIGGALTVKGQTACGITGTAKSQTLTHTTCPTGTKNTLFSKTQNESNSDFKVVLFPNPTKSNFKLKIESSIHETVQLKISDAQGRFMDIITFDSDKIMDFGDKLSPGFYLLELHMGNKIKTMSAVKY